MLKMMNYSMILRGKNTTAAELYDKLIVSIENVFHDVMSTGYINKTAHPEEYSLYHNRLKVIEGPW
jgi:hypothetical protein